MSLKTIHIGQVSIKMAPGASNVVPQTASQAYVLHKFVRKVTFLHFTATLLRNRYFCLSRHPSWRHLGRKVQSGRSRMPSQRLWGIQKYKKVVHKYTTGCHRDRTGIKSHIEILSFARTQPVEYPKTSTSIARRTKTTKITNDLMH